MIAARMANADEDRFFEWPARKHRPAAVIFYTEGNKGREVPLRIVQVQVRFVRPWPLI